MEKPGGTTTWAGGDKAAARRMSRRAAEKSTAILFAAALMGSGAVLAPSSAAPAAPAGQGQDSQEGELVVNGTLAQGQGTPTCFLAAGWGEHTVTRELSDDVPEGSAQGTRSYLQRMSNYVSGDAKLIQAEQDGCAPQVTAGQEYDLAVDYRASSERNAMTVFVHTAEGWRYHTDLKSLPASEGWITATARLEVPEGVDRISFGVSLHGNGELRTTNYSVHQAAPSPGTPSPSTPGQGPGATPPAQEGELVVNGALAQGQGTPTCFLAAGWGEHTVTRELSDDVPEGSPAGTRSYLQQMSNYVSGDAKLIQAEQDDCAPQVTAGQEYDLAVDYAATTADTALTVFVHTAEGWRYHTDLKTLPISEEWTTAQARLKVPEGVDRISFGVSLHGNGELRTTNYSVRHVAPEPEPPAGDPKLVGSWDVLNTEMPIRAIHTTLLNDGRLLLIAGSGNDGSQFAAGTFRAVVWDPDSNGFTEVPVPYDMFCAGHVTLPDGKVLLAGGTKAFPEQDNGPNTFKGSERSYYFDPKDDRFHELSDMAGAHWYPTLTKLGDGDVWAAGGLDEKAEGTVLTEMFDSEAMRWLPMQNVPQTWSYWGTYPHMFLLDDGMMFYSGGHTFGNGLPGTGASLYDWRTAQIHDIPGLREKDLRDQAGSVFVGPVQDQRIMIVGGGNTDGNAPATNLVDVLDLSEDAPAYQPGPDLPGPGKAYVNLVNLPDRTVLAANGARFNRTGDVHTAAIYDPQDNAWTSVDADPVGRNYHSSSILLPDGRVAVMGSNPLDNSFDLRISVYSPSYMFQGERPRLLSAPQQAGYGDVLDLEVAGDIVSASLMAPMSSTHQTDTNARLIDLPLAGTGADRTAQVPDNPNLVPPGPYMLTVLNADGVPSEAEWVWVS